MSSESDDDDDFVVYGTPLEPLTEDAIPKKRAITVEDQVATDKHGRRRFHGAFTGGFSAGFFNTVGSLEGWKPTQFTSSRTDRNKTLVQRAEDFMDDEDMDEFGFAPKTLQAKSNYNQVQSGLSRKRPLMEHTDGPIPGIPVLKTLVEPVRETIGIKVLMKLGWKFGQGVGPRLSKSEKTTFKNNQVKTFGCELPAGTQREQVTTDEVSEEEDGIGEGVTFAPDDYDPYVVKPKDNCFGLGYSGLDRSSVVSSSVSLFGPSLVMEENKKKVFITGQAFGVGAFENEDGDIYAKDDMSQYDFALDTPKMIAEKRLNERNKSRLALQLSSTDFLEGFVVASHHVIQKVYPPPALPHGFRPVHCAKPSRFSMPSDMRSLPQKQLTATDRAVIVNPEVSHQEKTLPNENKVPVSQSIEVDRTTSSFRPFVADPEKQIRYEKFLTLSKLGQSGKLRSLQPLTMTEWETERERREFEQAAQLYHLSTAFSDRFVSASQPDDATDPLAPVTPTEGVNKDFLEAAKLKMFGRLTRRIEDWNPHATLCKRFNIPQPGRSNNAMPAKISRPKFSIFNFLDMPSPSSGPSVSEMNTTGTSDTAEVDLTVRSEIDSKEADMDKNIEQLSESTNKLDLYKAIFLSSSDESEGEEEKHSSNNPLTATSDFKNNSVPQGIVLNVESLNSDSDNLLATESPNEKLKDLNILRNTSPPRGIFANLDRINSQRTLDSMDKTDKIVLSSEHFLISGKKEGSKYELSTDKVNINSMPVYGPPLPEGNPKFTPRLNPVTDNNSDSDQWVEMDGQNDPNDSSDKSDNRTCKKKTHDKKSHRKSKKHHKVKKKHKHKKKKSK